VRLIPDVREALCSLAPEKKLASAINAVRTSEPLTTCVNIATIKYAKEGERLKGGRGRTNIFLTTPASSTLFFASLLPHISSIYQSHAESFPLRLFNG